MHLHSGTTVPSALAIQIMVSLRSVAKLSTRYRLPGRRRLELHSRQSQAQSSDSARDTVSANGLGDTLFMFCRIRLNRGPGSLSGTGSMRRTGRGRSRSGSIFDGRAEDAARMLIGDDDEEREAMQDLQYRGD